MSNTITITGNLTDAVELKFAANGQAVGKFSIADNENRKNAAGEWEQVGVTFWRCTLFGKQAEAAADLVKGTQVIATGRAKTHGWTTPDGEKRSAMEVIVQTLGAVAREARESNRSESPTGSDPWGPQEPSF